MNTNDYTLQLMLVRLPVLAMSLRRIESVLCGALCAVIATIFWIIAVLCFAIWCLYKITGGMLWLIKVFWRVVTWPVEVVVVAAADGIWLVWVVLVWIGSRLYRLVVATARLLRRTGVQLRLALHSLGAWSVREFGEPLICLFCVYLGVLSTSFLPATLLLRLSPAALVGLIFSPLAAFAITARVFDIRAYRRWRSGGRSRLGVRVLRAYSDGLIWAMWLRRRQRAAV
jgi:hypothetical protein